MTRRLAREEGLLVGGSSGMAAYAAVQLAHELAGTPEGDDAVIVVLLPDSGRGYLTKVFNDEWLGKYGFLPAGDGQTVGQVLRGKGGHLPDLVHTHPQETVAEAVQILKEYGVSQMPVVRAEPPIVAAEVAGAVSEKALLDALYSGEARLSDPVEKHMGEPLPTIGASEPVEAAVAALGNADAAAGAGGRQARRGDHPAGPAGLPRPRLTGRTPSVEPSFEVLALLALAALFAGFVDAVVGGGGLVQLPALVIGLPGSLAGAGAGDQQAGLDLRDHCQLGDLLPAGAAAPGHVRAVDAARLRRLARRGAAGLQIPEEAFTPIVLTVLVVVGAYVLFKPDIGEVTKLRFCGSPAHARGDGRRVPDRHVRRRAGARHRVLPGLHAGRADGLLVPRGLRQGPDGQLGDQPRGAGGLRAPGRGAVGDRAADGGREPGRGLCRGPHRRRPGRGVRPGVLHRGGAARSWCGSAARCSVCGGDRPTASSRTRSRPRSR